MSLLPVHSFPAAIFIEARVVAPSARSLVSQLGVSLDAPDCSVAVFSRASGVLLVAGVGSYCAYRICTKYLGRRFVYMLLEASRVDQLATADRRLLYNQSDAVEDDVEEKEEDDTEWMERVSSAAGSQISRLSLFRRSASRGLYAIRSAPRSRDGVLSRRSNSGKSVSRAGSSASGRSASLQIVWEGGHQWDDEFAEAPTMVSTSRIARILPITATAPSHPAASMGDLCSVFDDVLSMVSGVDNTDELLLHREAYPDEEDVLNCTMKCMTDSKYMYRSVLDDDIVSDAGSMISRRSSLMKLSNARRMTAASAGLWSLASEEPSTSRGLLDVSQTESNMTKSFNSKRSSNKNSMFDSAIGAELSSEDGSVNLNKLGTLSESGLEWCDDGLLPIPISRNGFDWDMESNREGATGVSPMHRPTGSRDLMAFACQRYPPCSPQFKLLHTLYHRDRLRRVGECTEEAIAGQKQLELALQAALYHRRRIVQDKTWLDLEQRLEKAFNECDFLQRWPGRSKKDLQRYLHIYWDLIEFPGCGVEEDHIKGLEVLLVIESIEAYQMKMATGDVDWYEHDCPSTVLEKIRSGASLDTTTWNLLARCFDSSIEIIDVSIASQQPQYHRYGTGSSTLNWLKYGASPIPLFLVPEN